MEDYYSILGVSKTASQDEIKKAFRKLAMETHPDKHPGDKAAEEKFKKVNEAYSVLSDESKKRDYDAQQKAQQAFGGAGGARNFKFSEEEFVTDPFSFFSQFKNARSGTYTSPFGFEDFMSSAFGHQYHKPQENLALKYSVNISFEEAYNGSNRTVSFQRNIVCPECKGEGHDPSTKVEQCPQCKGSGYVNTHVGRTVCPNCQGKGISHSGKCKACNGMKVVKSTKEINIKIPAGAYDGMELRVKGLGNMSADGKSVGDLFLVISTPTYSSDGMFKRLPGGDIEANLQLSYFDLLLGSETKIKLPNREEKKLKISKFTQPGTKLRISGVGFHNIATGAAGNLYLNVQLKFPKKLTPEQEKNLKSLKEANPDL